ncbi:MAG TPA: tetratricopeptide repeat protein [Steroidobacteraceae bacterium]|nr:tetratricopeptide repeat protein [Steroidobacteraceae bacterium]
MRGRYPLLALTLLALCVPTARAASRCELRRVAELPVTMNGLRPLVPAKINGANAQFIVDSGAWYSLITPASAAAYKLHLEPAPYGLRIEGIGGSARASVATVDVFTLANSALRGEEFVVGGSDVGSGAAGLLGQNILRLADVEYDLANGVVRLWRPKDCGESALVYWPNPRGYSVMPIAWSSLMRPWTIGSAHLNGKELRVAFDSGAALSMVSLRAAERAGFNPAAPGVIFSGLSRGVGPGVVRTWIAPFDSFELGEEQIRHARLRVADMRLMDMDMLLGADFFLSHRIYVATSQRKLYFTYNGGPVFNLSAAPLGQQTAGAPAGAAAQSASSAASPGAAQSAGGAHSASASASSEAPFLASDQPTDAAGFSRRGAAYAARRDYAHAIADLDRACALAPSEPQYFYERGMAHLGNGQPFLAMTDFNQTLELKPDDLPALIARARLRVTGRDASGARADLDAADGLAAKQSDDRLEMGVLYLRSRLYAPAVKEFDLWIQSHPEDSRKADALNDRCWTRALWEQDLRKALGDCNTALRLRPNAVAFLDSRALVRMRLGELGDAIRDYDAVLKAEPKSTWSLYARGVAELRMGMTAAGNADIGAATAQHPTVVELAKSRGVTP